MRSTALVTAQARSASCCSSKIATAKPAARRSRSADREIPALYAGQGRARPGPARSRPHRAARADRRHRDAGRPDPARPLRHRRHAGVQPSSTTRSPGSTPIRRKPTSPMSRSASRVDARRRYLPRPCVQRHGRLAQPGTGAQFAILPPQNASGNWVKVVQRVPVRIYFDKHDEYVAQAEGRHERLCHDRHRPSPLARRPARLLAGGSGQQD